MVQFYFNFRCVNDNMSAQTLSESHFALSKVVEAVHFFNYKSHNIALAFPEMNVNHLGSIARVFGTKSEIEDFLLSPRAEILLKNGAFSQNEHINMVPDAHSWTVYKRIRKNEKNTLGYVERSHARLLERIKNGKSNMTKEEAEVRRMKLLNNVENNSPGQYVRLVSKSTKNIFSLFIESVHANEPGPGDFSSYGLSKYNSAVPTF